MNERERDREMELRMERWQEEREWLDFHDRLWDEANESMEAAVYHAKRAERSAKLAMIGFALVLVGTLISLTSIILRSYS